MEFYMHVKEKVNLEVRRNLHYMLNLKYSHVTKGHKTFLLLLKMVDVNKVFDVHALKTVEQTLCSTFL